MHGFYDSSNCDIASYSNDNTSSASSSNCNLEAVIDSLRGKHWQSVSMVYK